MSVKKHMKNTMQLVFQKKLLIYVFFYVKICYR